MQYALLLPLAISQAGDQSVPGAGMGDALLVALLFLVVTIGGSKLITGKCDITDEQ